jgi:hypothetical protein
MYREAAACMPTRKSTTKPNERFLTANHNNQMTAKNRVGYVQLVHTSTHWRTTGVGTRQGSYAFLMGRVGARWAQAVATVLEVTGGAGMR